MSELLPLFILIGIFASFIIIKLLLSIRVVPAQNAWIVERLGKYAKTLNAGFHVLVPFLDKIRYKHSLKERAVDVPSQSCFTQDNVQVQVDGVLYFKVVDPKKASYGIVKYEYATIQLAQTTMRSVIGKLELDRTLTERDKINAEVVKSVDEASDPWGIKVTRYEIQNISVAKNIQDTMELQMSAERGKRAEITKSIGEMEAKINRSIGIMEEAINMSEGEKQRRINEAEGRAQEILTLSKATATSIRKLAEAMQMEGGEEAVNLRVTESYIAELKNLARKNTQLVLPLDLSDVESLRNMFKKMLS